MNVQIHIAVEGDANTIPRQIIDFASRIAAMGDTANATEQVSEPKSRSKSKAKAEAATTAEANTPPPQQPVPQQPIPQQPVPQQPVPQQPVPQGWPMTQQQYDSARTMAQNALAGTYPPPQQPVQQPMPGVAPSYTIDQLSVAAMQLTDAGKVMELNALLREFLPGVQMPTLMQLQPNQYNNFALRLRQMGAQI